eukprot:4498020-Prymnesium_polylepis.1
MTRYTHLTHAADRVECRVTLATHTRDRQLSDNIVRQYIGSEQEHASTASYHRTLRATEIILRGGALC